MIKPVKTEVEIRGCLGLFWGIFTGFYSLFMINVRIIGSDIRSGQDSFSRDSYVGDIFANLFMAKLILPRHLAKPYLKVKMTQIPNFF